MPTIYPTPVDFFFTSVEKKHGGNTPNPKRVAYFSYVGRL